MGTIQISSPIGEGSIITKHALGSPAVGSATAIHAAVADTGAQQVITTGITQPDVPRRIVATPGGTTANVTAVSVTITGKDADGNTLVETLPAFTAGAATAKQSVNAFASITSIAQPAIGTGVTVSYGTDSSLGLGAALSRNTVLAAYLNGVKEATAPTVTTHATKSRNLIALNSALNGTPVIVDYYQVEGGSVALTVQRERTLPMWTSDRRLWLTADRSRVVEDGDPEARFLLAAAPGSQIPESVVKQYGIKRRDEMAAETPRESSVLDEAAFPTAGVEAGNETATVTEVAGKEEQTEGVGEGVQLGPEDVEPVKQAEPETQDKSVRGPKEPRRSSK